MTFQGGGVDFSALLENVVVELLSWQRIATKYIVTQRGRVLIFRRGIVFSAGAEGAQGRPATQQHLCKLIMYEI